MANIETRKKAVKKLRKDSGSPSGILMAVVEDHVIIDLEHRMDAIDLTAHEAMAFGQTLIKNAMKAGAR